MSEPPGGNFTFLFTDIEGSTRLWERSASAMRAALARHDEILGSAIDTCRGRVFKTVGDAFCAVFADSFDALEAALLAQRRLASERWDEGIGQIRVRMALHSGSAEERGGDYFGPSVNRVARLLSTGHGGQTLLSLATRERVRDRLPSGAAFRDLGERRLKDLVHSERIFQVVVPDLPDNFPPLNTLDARLNNLPVQPSPLVGREVEVAAVCELLRRREVRLLTLTGPGGTGKTRLGLQAAAELLDEHESGAFFVALAPIADPTLVASTVAQALGVVESGDRPLEVSLKEYLKEKELLLMLDNFEQVLEAAPLVGELLASCPRLKVLVTSRAALRVYGEHEYAVPPLALPDPDHHKSPEILGRNESVRLFVERSRAVKAGFGLTGENAREIAEICRRLDGLPLAIELAAARIRVLTPHAMLDRLSNRMKLLSGGARNLPARQQTIRSAIDWSHDLLNAAEQALFRRLAVFVGGCTLEAAEDVCGDESDLDIFDGVNSLVEKSLLRQEENEATDEVRFVMLETIREYASERLEESGEADELARLHAAYFMTMMEEAELELNGPRQRLWLDRQESEHDNLRAVLAWSLARGDGTLGLRLAGALGWFWWIRGYLSEGQKWLEEALAKDDPTSESVRAKAFNAMGGLLDRQGDYQRAKRLYEESLRLYRRAGDERGIAHALYNLGLLVLYEGDPERATPLMEESMDLFRTLGSKWDIGYALNGMGWLADAQGEDGRATALFEESLALSREVGNALVASTSLNNLGYTAVLRGDYEHAVALLEESLQLSRQVGSSEGLAQTSINLGFALRGLGEDDRATERFEESLALSQKLGDRLSTAECLEGLAGLAAGRGEAERAARLWGTAEALRESVGVPQTPAEQEMHESYLDDARSRLGQAAFAQARAAGRAAIPDEVVAHALDSRVST